jgi:hypothetical protein
MWEACVQELEPERPKIWVSWKLGWVSDIPVKLLKMRLGKPKLSGLAFGDRYLYAGLGTTLALTASQK